jgi:hypothetical protein
VNGAQPEGKRVFADSIHERRLQGNGADDESMAEPI